MNTPEGTCAAPLQAPLAGPPIALRMGTPPVEGEIFRLQGTKALIGAGPQCQLRLQVAGVAPAHCLLMRGPAGLFARALAGDTWINGCSFETTQLQPGDQLSVGPVELEVLEADAPVPPPSPAEDTVSRADDTGPGTMAPSEAEARRRQQRRVRRVLRRLRRMDQYQQQLQNQLENLKQREDQLLKQLNRALEELQEVHRSWESQEPDGREWDRPQGADGSGIDGGPRFDAADLHPDGLWPLPAGPEESTAAARPADSDDAPQPTSDGHLPLFDLQDPLPPSGQEPADEAPWAPDTELPWGEGDLPFGFDEAASADGETRGGQEPVAEPPAGSLDGFQEPSGAVEVHDEAPEDDPSDGIPSYGKETVVDPAPGEELEPSLEQPESAEGVAVSELTPVLAELGDQLSSAFDQWEREQEEAKSLGPEADVAPACAGPLDAAGGAGDVWADEDKTIDAYMTRLMQRIGGGWTSRSPEERSSDQENEPSVAADSATASPAEPQADPSAPAAQRRRARPVDEGRLDAFRAVANQTARHAIHRHSSRRKTQMATTRTFISIVSVMVGGSLASWAESWNSLPALLAVISFLIAGLCFVNSLILYIFGRFGRIEGDGSLETALADETKSAEAARPQAEALEQQTEPLAEVVSAETQGDQAGLAG